MVFRTDISQKFPLGAPESTLAQMAFSSNEYALKVQRLEKIQAQTSAQKLPEWLSYGYFGKITQNPHFQKKCKRETKRSFSKIAQTVALASMGQQHSGANVIIL